MNNKYVKCLILRINQSVSARFKNIRKIVEKVFDFPLEILTGTRDFWILDKAVPWNFCQSSLPSLREPEDSLEHSVREKANLLCTLFLPNSTLDSEGKALPIIRHSGGLSVGTRCVECFEQNDFRRFLHFFDVKKSSGPDVIPAIVLKIMSSRINFSSNAFVLTFFSPLVYCRLRGK
ncbi:unnamed protein product [Euphydryas editha]|uniref:Uncharacterized protein n=1 Tax=Euphydryas editha TaxID=104508 RepID=A0AAU9V3H4_EUPED|nr:unnamed protein product [Euphydryas editha]